MKKYVELSEDQRSLLDCAIDLLTPFAQKEMDRESRHTVYYKMGIEEASSEYDTCDNEKCIKQAKKQIRESYGKGTHIEENWYDNDGDHESIERCCICVRPLTSSLTWIEQELSHHEEYSVNLSDFEDGCTAFDVRVMLDAMPSCDHAIDEYAFHQDSIGNPEPLLQQTKWQNEFIERVMNYAKLVIKILS